ncbi:hypothetical protein [Nitrososphaera viennensis]|uniref:Uncharacterized protein n=2 Tax=Nitrososphaera viennensis TaxID=1034015 RepID=A0A060HPA8_9ARCH|nr:hypothetical protein [Nitrososphaera viennensis]AIC16950.1 hypothetical protein NVIE_026780 [Nitrososphaera viennensis EN76]UVS68853.1 hypothetical protein NWT39_13210 [Nitrososphaera viennensis]
MSETWKVAGQSSDLTKTVEMLVKEKLESQWTETDPPAASIDFGTGWGAGMTKNYAVHCLHASTTSAPVVNGWSKYMYETLVDVHVFALRTTLFEPDQLRKMRQHIDKIIAQNKASLGQGISSMRLVRWTAAHDPKDITDTPYWHLVGHHKITYYKVNTA